MHRLFDHDVATPERPKPDVARQRRAEDEPQLYPHAPGAVWSLLLDRGVDPLALAELLRDGLDTSERRRAYLELVRDVGAPLARRLWRDALAGVTLQRGELPADARAVAEAALGQSLPRVDVMSGTAVDALTARLGTPAYTVGRQLFVRRGAAPTPVLVHEAIHAAQQANASARKAGAPSAAAEREAHSFLRRLGPLDAAPSLLADRARASMAVRAALGRAPRVTARPLQLAAYEATHPHVDGVLGEAQRLADALVRLLDRGALRHEVQALLGPEGDGHQARVRATAMHALGGRRVADGRDARTALAEKLGGVDAKKTGKALPSSLRAELEARLGASFAGVRVHDDAGAAADAQRLGARAFTQGQDVYFADGKYDPTSPEGRRLVAHELTHVAQQAGAAATSAPSVSPSGSAVEREADRVSHAFADGARAGADAFEIRERAPAGTISRDDGSGGGGAPSKWHMSLMQRSLDLTSQLSGARDLGDGRKQVDVNQSLGPIRITKATFHAAGDTVDSGTLAAAIDAGPFRGGQGSLTVDKEGAVSGTLSLPVNVPGALLKNIAVDVGTDGFRGTANLAPNDLVSRDFPVQATDFVVTVASSPAGGVDVSIEGGATVNVANGMASGTAHMTAQMHSGPTGLTFAATLDGTIDIAGLQASVQATIGWDGKNITVTAGADIPVKLPGLEGLAHVRYAEGKLAIAGENVRFTLPQLQAVVFDEVRVEDGKLKAALHLGSPVTLPLPGGGAAALSASTLQIDGTNVSGDASGTFSVGPGGAAALSGNLSVAYHAGQLDGSVTIANAGVPGLSVQGLTLSVQDLFRSNKFTPSGNVEINVGNGLVTGHWANLAMDPGGSLTGQVGVHFGVPRVGLPDININVLPGWRIAATTQGGPVSLDLGGALGQLSQLTASVAVAETDIRNIPRALGDITITGANVAPPSLASIGALDQVNLHIPGAGGRYDFAQIAGSAALRITAFPGAPISIGLRYANGQLSTQAEVDVDVHQIIPPLAGNLKVGYQSGQANPISVHGTGLGASDPRIAQKISVPNISYAGGNLSGDIAFASGPISVGPVSGNVTNGAIHFAKPQAGPVQLTGQVDVQMAAAGANATGHISYDEHGQLKVEGTVAVPLASLTNGVMTGTLVASNEGGATSLQCNNANFASGPLAGVFPQGITVRKTGAALTADAKLDVAALEKFLPEGVTPSGTIALNVHKDNDGDKLHFSPSGNVSVAIGGDFLSATLALNEAADGLGATVTADVKVKPPNVTISGQATLKIDAQKKVSLVDGAHIDVDVLASTVKATIKPLLAGNKIAGVTVDGNVKDTKFSNATPFSFRYDNGSWSADANIGLKEIPGILHGGSLAFGYDKTGGFHAKAEKIPLAGPLQGLSIDEAHLDGKDFGATISGGKDITAGNVKISIDAASKLSFDSKAGLNGTAKGSVKLGALPQLNVSVTAKGNEAPIDIHADSDIGLDTISKFLDGKLHVSYDRNQGANAFGFKATNVAVNADPIKRQVVFSNLDAHWDGNGVVGTLTAAKVNVKAGVDVTIDGGTVDLLPGNKLNGDLQAHLTAGGSSAHVTVGWANGQFKWEAGGTMQLGQLTSDVLEGEVEASAGSGGGAIKSNTPISFGKSAPEIAKTIKINSLSGSVKPGAVAVSIELDATQAIEKIVGDVGDDLKVDIKKAPVKVDYATGAGVSMKTHVKGHASYAPGGKEIIQGSFDVGWNGGFAAKVDEIQINVGDGFHSNGASIDLNTGDIKLGTTIFHVDGFADGKVSGSGNVRQKTFTLDTDLKVPKLDGLEVSVHADKTKVSGELRKSGPAIQIGPASLTVLAGSSAELGNGGALAAHLKAKLEVPKVGHAELDADFKKGVGFSGHATFDVEKFAIFDNTSGGLKFEGGQISTDAPIALNLTNEYETYMEAGVTFELANNKPHVTGQIKKLKPVLGKIAEAFHGAKVDYKDGDITVNTKFDISRVIGDGKVLSESDLVIAYANKVVTVDGTLRPKDLYNGTIHFDEASQVHVNWSSKTKQVKVDGNAHADINQLATIKLDVLANAGGGDPAAFDLDGNIDATGLKKYIHNVDFGSITGAVHAHVGGGTPGELKVTVDADVVGIAGISGCKAHIHGDLEKNKGLSGYVQVDEIKVGEVIASGRVNLKDNKFDSGKVHLAAAFPQLRIEGDGDIQASELGALSTKAKLTVIPGEGSALSKFVQSGSIEVEVHKFQLEQAKGELNLVPPDFLKLYDPKVVISYQRGKGIDAVLETQFDAPFQKNGEKGNFKAGYEHDRGLFAEINFPITLPACEQATVGGKLDKQGFSLTADLKARKNPYVRDAHIEIGYGGGGFHFLGKVTLTPDPEHEMEVGVQYQQGQGFSILGVDLKDKHEDKGDHPVKGFQKSAEIPLASIGVASLNLKLGVGVDAGFRMPKVKLRDPKIEGGLEALDSGGLPAISFGGTVAMGAYLALFFSIQITGKIDLLVAEAEAGIGAKITALLNLELGTDVSGRYEQGKGANLKFDPFVHASLDLIASLIATLYASIAWFTIVDKHYTLGSANLAHIDLGTFKPFNPIELQLGGPGGTHLVSGLHLRDGATDDMEKGVQEGSKKASDNEANKESKQKLAPVLKSMRAAAVQFENLPEGWENGMVSAPVDFDSMFHIDGDAWNFYREHADDAETIDPEDACTSPTQKLAKAVAQASKNNPAFAGRIVLEWRRAQIAHMGVNPDTGVNVVQEREEVQALVAEKYAKDLAEALEKQKEQDDEWAAHVAKQAADWHKAEQEHHHKIAVQKAEHEHKVKHHEDEGKKAQKQVEDAEKQAAKEGATEKPKDSDKAPPPQPPPEPPVPPPLAKPAPILKPPPVPLPPPLLVLPGVTLPALPADPGVSINIFTPVKASAKKVQAKLPGGGDGPPAGSSPDPAPGQASGQAKGPTGGSALPAGDGGPKGSKPSGGGGAVPPGPQVAAGPAGIISQAKTLDAKKAELGGGGGKGGGKGAAPAAAAAAAAAATAAPGAKGAHDGKGSKDKHAGAKKDAVPKGQLDPTVQKVADKGKQDEEKQNKALHQKELEYKQKIDAKLKGAETASVSLEHAADDAHKKHEMPAAGAFPPGTVEQARVAFSNFVKLKREGETFASFKEKYAQKKAFNFDVKAFVDVVQELQKIHDAMKPEDTLPEPKDFAGKLYAGNTYAAKAYRPGAGFDAGYSLSDETLKALEAFDKFKANNKGHKPGQYVIGEVEKMNDAEKTAFIMSKLVALAAAAEAVKVLRVALDKLGPQAQVQARVAEIDGGKLVAAPDFWTQMVAAFNQGVAGIAQMNDVVAKMQAKEPKGGDKAAAGGGDGKEAKPADSKTSDAKPAEAKKPADNKAADSKSAAGKSGDGKSADKKSADAKNGDAKGGAQEQAKATANTPPGSDGGAQPAPPPAMVGIENIEGQLSAADQMWHVPVIAQSIGIDQTVDVAVNKAALLARRTTELQALVKQHPELTPAKVYAQWKEKVQTALHLMRQNAQLQSWKYEKAIGAARAQTPRLSPEGVRAAVEQLRHSVGSAKLPPMQVAELNPAGVTKDETVPDAVISGPVDGANWNPAFDGPWCDRVLAPDAFDPSLLGAAADAKNGAAANAKKADVADGKSKDAAGANANGPVGAKPNDAAGTKPNGAAGAKPNDAAGAKPNDKPAAATADGGAAKPVEGGGAAATSNAATAHPSPHPGAPKALVGSPMQKLEEPSQAFAKDAQKIVDGQVLYQAPEQDPVAVATHVVNDMHGQFDEQSKTLTLPRLDTAAITSSATVAAMAQQIGQQSGVARVVAHRSDEKITLTGEINPTYTFVEITDARGAPLGEFDSVVHDGKATDKFVEDKSAKGLNHPKNKLTADDWAKKQIFDKTDVRIANLGAAATSRPRPDGAGSATVPTVAELRTVKEFEFVIESASPDVKTAVEKQLAALRTKYPTYKFSAKYGP